MKYVNVGDYVKYKDHYYVVVGGDDTLVKILDVNSNKKLQVNNENLGRTEWACDEVTHGGTDYLVTLKDKLIISLTSNRVMKWGSTHGIRKMIIEQT